MSLKVGLVCPYNIFRGGGVQECVLALQSELTKRGHVAKIITPMHRVHTDGKVPANTIFVGTSTDIKSPFHTTAQVSVSLDMNMTEKMLQEEKFDILHFHEPWVPIMSRQLLSRSKAVNIATFHAKLPETVMTRTIERVITPYTRSVLKYLDQLTAVSDAAAEYVTTLTKKPIEIIPNGIDLDKYSAKSEKRKAKSEKKNILYIGRLEKRKGVEYLLWAYLELTKQRDDVELLIAGDGTDKHKLELLVNEYELPRVKFLGYVNESQKMTLMEKADIFCSPALYGESFGIVLLEAMAKGAVVIAGNNPGYASVMKDKGRLSIVNPKDTIEFARRLSLLLDDTDLRELWRQWALDYVKQFDYRHIVDEYEKLYKKAIKIKV